MLSAVYLACDTKGELSDDFRRRATVMELLAGLFAAITFALAARHAPVLYQNLAGSHWAGPLQLVTAALALSTLGLLHSRKLQWARLTAAAQVAMVVLGWGVAMRGHFILPDVSIASAGARPEIMPALATALGLGAMVLVPALGYLYWLFKRPDTRR
jgi:cytochrome d ubiquinol oxidase subunit II